MVANSYTSWYAYWYAYWDSYETLWLSWGFLAQDFATVHSSLGNGPFIVDLPITMVIFDSYVS
jgi:hypothetical protein